MRSLERARFPSTAAKCHRSTSVGPKSVARATGLREPNPLVSDGQVLLSLWAQGGGLRIRTIRYILSAHGLPLATAGPGAEYSRPEVAFQNVRVRFRPPHAVSCCVPGGSVCWACSRALKRGSTFHGAKWLRVPPRLVPVPYWLRRRACNRGLARGPHSFRSSRCRLATNVDLAGSYREHATVPHQAPWFRESPSASAATSVLRSLTPPAPVRRWLRGLLVSSWSGWS